MVLKKMRRAIFSYEMLEKLPVRSSVISIILAIAGSFWVIGLWKKCRIGFFFSI